MTIAQNEIETKLVAPSREELSNLSLILPRLGRLKGASTCESVRDIYLDTRSCLLLQAGAACRIRQVNGRIFLTLKALTPPRHGICCRRETE
ncbi:MAG: CYTH domain-containing protein, partial [Kiritimatiellia bacterium]